MTAAAAVARRGVRRERVSIARALALAIVLGAAIFGVLLVVLSLLPASTLAARLLGVAGEADRAGAHTQDVLAHFGDRLRFAGAGFLALAAALALLRGPFEDMLRGVGADVRSKPAWRLRWSEVLLVAAVTLGALALRLAFVNQPMRYDEALTFNELASRPLYYGLSYYPDPNNHLLNTLLVHTVFVGLGNQPWVVRLPALIAGALLAPATYLLARALDQRPATALLAAGLVAASSYIVEYSTNSRGYTLQALCFVVMLGLIQVAVRRQSASALLLAALVAALGVYALPTMVYGVAVAAVWFVLGVKNAGSVGRLAVAGMMLALVALLLYLPVILISGPESLVGNRFVVPLGASELWQQLPASLGRTWSLWNRDVAWPLAALLLAGFVVSVGGELRQRRLPLGLLAPVICMVLVLMQRVAPFERVWLFLLPLYFVVSAAGLSHLGNFLATASSARPGDSVAPAAIGRLGNGVGPAWFLRLGPVVALLAAAAMAFAVITSGSILSSTETGAFPDAEAVARRLSGQLQPSDAVLTELPASLPELQYYFPRIGLSTEPLVREPSQATRLFVVAAPGTEPSVPGWGQPRTLETFRASELVELQRE